MLYQLDISHISAITYLGNQILDLNADWDCMMAVMPPFEIFLGNLRCQVNNCAVGVMYYELY